MNWNCECGFCDSEIKDLEEFYSVYGGYLHSKCRSEAEKRLAIDRDWELLTALDCANVQVMNQEYRDKQLEIIKRNENRP
jgi:hypothetical protein